MAGSLVRRLLPLLTCICVVLSSRGSTAVLAADDRHDGSRFVLESQRSIYSVDDQTPPPHNQVHFPYLHEAEDGTWYMAHHEGPHHGGTRVFGLTWDDELAKYLTDDRPQTVMSNDQGATWRPWPGMPHRERDMRLAITTRADGTLMSYLSYFDEAAEGSAILCLLHSHDDGATWTRQDVPVTGLPLEGKRRGVLWGRIIEIAADHLLAPYYGEQSSGKDGGKPRYFTGILHSLDGGATWKHLAVIAGGDTQGEEGPNESDIIHLGGQELYSVFRTGDKEGSVMHESRSFDLGATWSEPAAFPGGDEGVSPQLVKMGNDLLVVVFGRRVSGDRAIIARISADGGRTWRAPFRVFEGTGKVYANLQILPGNRLRVVYDASPFDQPDGTTTNDIVRAVLRIE